MQAGMHTTHPFFTPPAVPHGALFASVLDYWTRQGEVTHGWQQKSRIPQQSIAYLPMINRRCANPQKLLIYPRDKIIMGCYWSPFWEPCWDFGRCCSARNRHRGAIIIVGCQSKLIAAANASWKGCDTRALFAPWLCICGMLSSEDVGGSGNLTLRLYANAE